MYREFVIEDADGNKIELHVHPEYGVHKWKDFIEVISFDVNLTLETKKLLSEFIGVAAKFMNGNTIERVEVKEVM